MAVPLPMPALRQVPAEIFCTLGWIYGTLHTPTHQSLLDFLTLSGASIKLTRVRVPQEPDLLGFLDLRRDSISLIAPPRDATGAAAGAHGAVNTRDIACLFEESILRGSLEVPVGLRLSDYLRQEGPYLVLRHCMLTPFGATLNSPGAKTLDLAIVNLEQVVGVSETS